MMVRDIELRYTKMQIMMIVTDVKFTEIAKK